MKKNNNKLTALGVFAVSAIILLAFSNADANASIFAPNTLSIGDLQTKLSTPDAIAKFMWRHFEYVLDQRQFGDEEKWQSPSEILTTRKGDCEDFALFAQEMLKANGISSFLLNVYADGFAHTVCVFKENGGFNVIDGTSVKRYEAKDLNELSKMIHPDWEKSAIVKKSTQTDGGKILKSFENKMKAHGALVSFA